MPKVALFLLTLHGFHILGGAALTIEDVHVN